MPLRFLLPWLLCVAAFALPQNQPIDFFSTRHGLVHNHITALFHQKNGYLWIGTVGGLSRFDGQQFDNFSDEDAAPTGKITAMEQTQDGRIWFASHRRLTYWQAGTFYTAKVFDTSIRRLLASSDGQLWVALDGGLAQYQDEAWHLYDAKAGFPEFHITQLFEDPDQKIWIGMRNGGIVHLDPHSKSWERYTREHGLPNMTVNHFLLASDGTFWIATHGGVVSFKDGEFIPAPFNDELPSPIIYKLFEDREEALWLTASNAGVARWDQRDLIIYNEKSGLASNYSSSFLQDHWGHLWILCRKGVSIYFDGAMAPLNPSDGLQGRIMTTFIEGHDGIIWIGTSGGLNRYEEPRLKNFIYDTTDRLVQSSAIRSIYRDRSGRAWFPTYKGLGCKDGRKFTTFTEEDGLPSKLVLHWSETSNGNIWVGTERGAAFLEGTSFVQIEDPRFVDQVVLKMAVDPSDRLWILLGDGNLYRGSAENNHGPFRHIGRFEGVLDIIAQDQDHLWLSQLKGLTHIGPSDQQTFHPLETITHGEGIISRLFDKQGSWWFATRKGLFRFDGKESFHYSQFGGEKAHGVAAMYKGLGNRIWFNTIETTSEWPMNPSYTGLGLYEDDKFTHYSRDQGLHSRVHHQVFVDNRDQEWFFSTKGLSWLEDGEAKHISVDDGLAGNRPYHLFWDRNDHLWIGSNGGLNKRSGDLMTTLGPRDGLLNPYVYSGFEDNLGDIWIRTAASVQRYRENPNPPEIDLMGIYNDDQALPLENGLKLAHHQNNLIFQMRGIHLGKGAEQMQFDYKLKGNGKVSRGITRESKLHFPGLGPGNYSFHIMAYNRDLASSKEPREFQFTIRPPWWFSLPFLISAILFGALFSYMLYRIRLRVRLEKARVFSELATAHEMQLSLMPKKAPTTSKLDVFGTCEPAKEVGGDYYDYFWLDEDRQELGIAIMDVAGKSMEAAIISVMASGLVCSEIGQQHAPAQILARMNFPMYQKTGKKIFTTGLVGALHTKSYRFRWSNAGHMDPILIRDGKMLPLDTGAKRDLPLGAVRQWDYQEYEVQLQPGDLLYVYTDGLNEASNKDGDFFGEQRLIDYLEAHLHQSSKELVHGLLEEVKEFAGQMPQYDDITMVAIKVISDI